MILNLILIPWLCALITGIIAAPIGALIAWRRLVYFGEALSHASLLGIALALKSGLPPVVGIWSITLLLVALLYLIEKDGRENPSNILGSLSHIALALGMVLLSTMENIRTDLINYLFGDILATGAGDLANITIVALIGGALLYRLWQPLILMTISPAIARTEHPRARHYDLAFLLLIGLFIGTTVQYFGLLLVIALLTYAFTRPGKNGKGLGATVTSLFLGVAFFLSALISYVPVTYALPRIRDAIDGPQTVTIISCRFEQDTHTEKRSRHSSTTVYDNKFIMTAADYTRHTTTFETGSQTSIQHATGVGAFLYDACVTRSGSATFTVDVYRHSWVLVDVRGE